MTKHISAFGKQLTRIGLGGMPLSLSGRPSAAQAFAVIKTFVESGGNFIDTANVYCVDDDDVGHNERLISQALAELGASTQVLVATKGGLTRPKGGWEVDARPQFLRQSCEASLRALNTGQIALYQLHAVDPKVPFADSLGELMRLQAEGKIAHIGLSNIQPQHLLTAVTMTAIASVQNRCNIGQHRDVKTGLVALCAQHGALFLPHSPVGGHYDHRKLTTHPQLQNLAEKYQCSAYGIALAWLLAQGEHVLPIPGASRSASIADSLQALQINLSAEDLAQLNTTR